MLVTKFEVFILITYSLVGLNLILIAKGLTWLEVTNDGPAILDSTINFFATLKGDKLEDNYLYRFQSNAIKESSKEIMSSVNCTYNVHVTKSSYIKGNFTMQVTVFHVEIIRTKEIASNNTLFTLTDTINGDMVVSKGGNVEHRMYFATGENVNFTLHIYDPNDFFENATLFYAWIVDGTRWYRSIMPYNFSRTGKSNVSLTVIADNSNQIAKWGFFSKELIIQDQIPRINVIGNTYIPHGKMLNLNATCYGSSPFHYCWRIYPGDAPEANFSCDYPLVSHLCQFSVNYYIAVTGQYYFSIFVANEVSTQRKSLDVRVYDTSHVPQLSVTIIPITCIVLAIIIVVTGIAYYFHQRKHYTIEVADFDFAYSEEIEERTFFGRLYDTMKKTLPCMKQSSIRKSINNGRSTVKYGSLTNCRRNVPDTSTPHVC